MAFRQRSAELDQQHTLSCASSANFTKLTSVSSKKHPMFQTTASGTLKTFHRNSHTTTKRDLLHLLRIEGFEEGAYYLTPNRIVNAEFLRMFLAGEQKLLKVEELKFVRYVFGFKKMQTRQILQDFSDRHMIQLHLPNSVNETKFDRGHVLNVL